MRRELALVWYAKPLHGTHDRAYQQQRAFKLATLPTAIVVAVTAACYVPFVVLLSFLVREYLPLYADATTVIKFAVIAGALRLADFYASFAVLCNQERKLAWAFGALVLVASVVILCARSIGNVRFDPDPMVIMTVAVSACGFRGNFAVAARAQRQRRALVPA